MAEEKEPFTQDPDEVRDLGFGEAVARGERNRLLNMFECPDHGTGCVPHAMEEVKRLRDGEYCARCHEAAYP